MRGNRGQITEYQEQMLEANQKIVERLTTIQELLEGQKLFAEGDVEPEDIGISEVPTIDPLAHLHILEEMEGLHEDNNHADIMRRFNKHGIVLDVAILPWCGACIRYALAEAGYELPSDVYNKASQWQNYGEECSPDEPGAILVYHTHVSLRTQDGGEIGGNVSDSVRKTPPGQKWFGDPIAARKPIAV